jgi:hypothetical protein
VAKAVAIQTAVHRDVGRDHRVNTKVAHMSYAKAADMRAA